MGFCACIGSITSCPFGAAPGTLMVLPSTVFGPTGPIGTCMNFVPFLNVIPFGVCMSMANPITAALTAAAFGVLTPGPCIPTPVGPWLPMKPTVILPMGPVLTDSSILMCAFGGVIKINASAQFAAMS